MRKVSAILPVLNEEKLLPTVLKNLLPHVDEVIAIDGGPEGPSTDNSQEILHQFGDKVKYFSGTYKDSYGTWDAGVQKNIGVKEAAGEVLLFVSCDMFFTHLDILIEAVAEQEDKLIFFTSMIEFWLNTKNMRLPSNDGNGLFSLPSSIVTMAGLDRSLAPTFDEAGSLKSKEALLERRLLLPQIVKYHAGWIRCFREQVNKHISHIKQRRWGGLGEELLGGGDKAIEHWAIRHVLSYENTPSVDISVKVPEEAEIFNGMEYNKGYGDIVDEFEAKYKETVFK